MLWADLAIMPFTIGRVETWRGGVGWTYLFPPLSFGGASIAQPCCVSTSRSSNEYPRTVPPRRRIDDFKILRGRAESS